MWTICPSAMAYILGLMPGLEDMSLIGSSYNEAVRVEFMTMSHPKYGCVVYHSEHDLFWTVGTSSRKNLEDMTFGLNGNQIVCGKDASETTYESGLHLCKRAPYGARRFIKEFFSN